MMGCLCILVSVLLCHIICVVCCGVVMICGYTHTRFVSFLRRYCCISDEILWVVEHTHTCYGLYEIMSIQLTLASLSLSLIVGHRESPTMWYCGQHPMFRNYYFFKSKPSRQAITYTRTKETHTLRNTTRPARESRESNEHTNIHKTGVGAHVDKLYIYIYFYSMCVAVVSMLLQRVVVLSRRVEIVPHCIAIITQITSHTTNDDKTSTLNTATIAS